MKSTALTLPVSYTGIIDQEEYTHIMDLCRNYLINEGETILRVAEGEIVLKQEEEEKRYFLDNLVRLLAQHERQDWADLVSNHFNKLKDVPFALDYLYDDFDYAAQFLKVLIRSNDFLEAENILRRVNLPGTFTFLVLDFNERFTYINEEDAKGWNKSLDELFEIAFVNVANEEIDIDEILLEETLPVYAFCDGNFSASYIVEIERNANFAIGSHGCVVAIPTKGSAFIHPIETKDVMQLIGALAEITYPIYTEDPGAINTDFYWYFKGKFELFPAEPAEDGYATIKLPSALSDRLELI